MGREKNKKRRGFKIFFTGGFFLLLAAGIFYLLVFVPFFTINEIRIDGAKEVQAKGLEELSHSIMDEKIFGKIPKNNLLFFPQKKIESAALEQFPEIKSAVLSKNIFRHGAILKIEERKATAIWCSVKPSENSAATSSEAQGTSPYAFSPLAEKCFFVDSGGYVFGTAPILSGGTIPIVYDSASGNLDLRRIVSNQKTLEFILLIKKELAKINLNLTDFVVKSQAQGGLEIIAPDGWLIFLDINGSAPLQANALKRSLQEEIKEKRALLEYVDLRVENRVYYKLK